MVNHVRRAGQPWVVVLVVALVYLGGVLARSAGDVDAFVLTGTCFSSCHFDRAHDCPTGTDTGYDGQFAYYIARDPAHASGCLDVPAYRYQRILLPLAARALALGVTPALPLALVAVNLSALVVSVALLQELLRALKVSRWYALVYGLFFGVLVGVRLSTTEPLAYGLVIVAIWLHHRERDSWAALALLGAMLTKETTGLFVGGFGLYYLLHGRWREIVRLGVIVGVPFVLWQIYLWQWLGEFAAGSGGRERSGFEIIPFNGFWRILTDSHDLALFFVLGMLIAPAVVIPSVWGLWASGRTLWQRREEAHLYTCLHFANVAVMPFIPFSTYVEILGILRFVVGLVLSHLLFSALRYPRRRPLTYSALWLVYLLLVVNG